MRTRSISRWPRDFDKNSAIDENSTATRGLSFFSRRENILHSGKRSKNKNKTEQILGKTKCFDGLVFYAFQIVVGNVNSNKYNMYLKMSQFIGMNFRSETQIVSARLNLRRQNYIYKSQIFRIVCSKEHFNFK